MVDRKFSVLGSMPTRGVLALKVVGDLDADTADRLTNELGEWLGIDELIIELHECTFIDSHGLGALLACRQAIGSEASMRLLGVPADFVHTICLAGLETVLGLDPAS